MTTRDHAPAGAPNWAHLLTSDVAVSRSFYTELFGWEADEPSSEFGGYFMFTRDGRPVAGGMGGHGGMDEHDVSDTWTVYFETADIDRAASAVRSAGGTVHFDPMPVADLGVQMDFSDPSGARAGLWQPRQFHGFDELDVPGCPSWFELHTPRHAEAVTFYRSVLDWQVDFVADTDEFRYAVVANADGVEGGVAGLMDNRNDLAESQPGFWTIYFESADVEGTVEKALELGGTVTHPAEATPYGVLAAMEDPTGASFSLRCSPPTG